MTGRHRKARPEGMVRAQAPMPPAGRPTGEVAA